MIILKVLAIVAGLICLVVLIGMVKNASHDHPNYLREEDI